MADLLISPEGYVTPGGVPRKLLAGVFLVITSAAMAVFMLTSTDAAPMTGDQKARAELMKPESVAAQAKGNGKWVDEAAEHARLDLDRAARARASAATEPVVPSGPAAIPPPYPLPSLPTLQGRASGISGRGDLPAAPDAAAVERELAARSATAVVFDDAGKGPSAAVSRGGGDPFGSAGTQPAEGGAALGASQAMAPIVDAIKATHGAVPNLTRAESDRAWALQAANSSSDAVLRVRPSAAELMLYQGTVIPCVLTRRLNSDMPGVVTARVSMDVYDSRTSRRLLLPKGSQLVGAYNNDVKAGQSRLQFAFTRLKLPDGSTFDLPGATGADAIGQAGVGGDVDRHFLRTFGSALLLGVLADRVTKVAALPNGGLAGQGGLSATGQVFVDAARAELDRNRTIPPTVTVPEGARINVEVVRDMVFSTVQEKD